MKTKNKFALGVTVSFLLFFCLNNVLAVDLNAGNTDLVEERKGDCLNVSGCFDSCDENQAGCSTEEIDHFCPSTVSRNSSCIIGGGNTVLKSSLTSYACFNTYSSGGSFRGCGNFGVPNGLGGNRCWCEGSSMRCCDDGYAENIFEGNTYATVRLYRCYRSELDFYCQYSWNTSSWSNCSVDCGVGNQTRTVQCERGDGTMVADSYCSGAKPVSSQNCNTQDCVCGSRHTTYSSIVPAWVQNTTYCQTGTNSNALNNVAATLPAFPSAGSFVNWNCKSGDGQATLCTAFRNPYPTLTITASPPNPITYSGSVTLTWTPANADSCWASGDWSGSRLETGGSETISGLLTKKTYTIECWDIDSNTSGEKSVTVLVSLPPTPGVCGDSSDTFSCTESKTEDWFDNNLCAIGDPTPLKENLSFPSPKDPPIEWKCCNSGFCTSENECKASRKPCGQSNWRE